MKWGTPSSFFIRFSPLLFYKPTILVGSFLYFLPYRRCFPFSLLVAQRHLWSMHRAITFYASFMLLTVSPSIGLYICLPSSLTVLSSYHPLLLRRSSTSTQSPLHLPFVFDLLLGATAHSPFLSQHRGYVEFLYIVSSPSSSVQLARLLIAISSLANSSHSDVRPELGARGS